MRAVPAALARTKTCRKIQTEPSGYQLAVPAERIDLWEFRELLRRASARAFWETALATLKEYDDPAAQKVHEAIDAPHTGPPECGR